MDFSKEDKKWQRFNQKLQKQMQSNDFFGLGTTYYEMAAYIQKEGGNPTEYKSLGHKMKLNASNPVLNDFERSEVVDQVEILAATDSCEFCKNIQGTILSISEAKNIQLIPNANCTHIYGCRCVYLPVVDIEK